MENINTSSTFYLNQRLVFDMLAAMEDGFSQIASIEKEISLGNSVAGDLSAGAKIPFFPVQLSGGVKGDHTTESKEKRSEVKVHTPASLFVKLVNLLGENKIKTIKTIKSVNDLKSLITGDIVCFKGFFKKNPVIEILESVQQIFDLIVLFDGFNDNKNMTSNNKSNKGKSKDNDVYRKKIAELLTNMKSKGISDITCKTNDNISIVLQAYDDCFYNKNMNEIIDGEFSVIAKVVMISTEENEKAINLLRNTPLSCLSVAILDSIKGLLTQDELSKFLSLPNFELEIKGNSLLVVPIGIYS